MKLLALSSLLFVLAFSAVESAVLVAVPDDATAYHHDIHTMSCVAFGQPLPQISWSKAGSGSIVSGSDPSIYINTTTVTSSDGKVFAVSMLSFCGLRTSDSGSYSCSVQSANNDQYNFLSGSGSATFSLTVTVQPATLSMFSIDMDTGVLALTFTKPLNISSFKPTFTLQNTASSPTASVTPNVQIQTTVNSAVVNVLIPSNDLDTVKSTAGLYSSAADSYLSFSTGGGRDLEGAYILPVGMGEAVQASSYADDLTRPLITAVTVFDLDSGTFDMVANEAVNPMSLMSGRITVQNAQSNPGTAYTLLAAQASMLNTPRRVRVTMSVPDVGEIKVLPNLGNTTSTLWVSFSLGAINDYNDNPVLSSVLSVDSLIPDTTPPSLQCFDLDMNIGVIGLSFNDIVIASSLSIGQLRLQRGPSATSGYQLIDKTLDFGQSVYIQVTIPVDLFFSMKTDNSFATMLSNTYISASQGFVIDIYNRAAFGISSSNATQSCRLIGDSTPPMVIGFSLDLDEGYFIVSFDDPVLPSSFQPAQMNFRSNVTSLPVLSGGVVTPTSNASVVQISLTADDLTNIHNDQIIGSATAPSRTILNVASGAISDYNNNQVVPSTTAAKTVTVDNTAPSVSGFALDLMTGQVIITFSEPVLVVSQQQFIDSITISNSPTSPIVMLNSASTTNPIMFTMTAGNIVTLQLPSDLQALIDSSTAIANSINDLHLSFSSTNSVNDLTGLNLPAGFTQATGIVRSCTLNTYNDVSSGTCKSCPSACREGCTGPNTFVGDNGCQRCEVLDSTTDPVRCFDPADGCPVGTYPVSSGAQIIPYQDRLSGDNRAVCFACNSICARCTGSSTTQCTACSHATIPIATGVQCVASCVGNSNCFYCDNECNGCRHNATDCAGCKNDKVRYNGRDVCVPSCNAVSEYLHFLPTGTAECSACSPNCNGCNGPAVTDCIACKNVTQPNSAGSGFVCQDTCSNGYYANASQYCLPCFRNCKRCTGPGSTQCNVCMFEDDSINRAEFVNCQTSCGIGYSLDVLGGDCDLDVATWLVPLIVLVILVLGGVVLLIFVWVMVSRTRQKAEKKITTVGFSSETGDIQYEDKSDLAPIVTGDFDEST